MDHRPSTVQAPLLHTLPWGMAATRFASIFCKLHCLFSSRKAVCLSSRRAFVCAPSSPLRTSLHRFGFLLIPICSSHLSFHVTSLENPWPTLIGTNFLVLFLFSQKCALFSEYQSCYYLLLLSVSHWTHVLTCANCQHRSCVGFWWSSEFFKL